MMLRFRHVELPEEIPGALYLHSLPGRYEPLEAVWEEIRRCGISAIVCLIPDEEIAEKSPDYLAALDQGTTPCEVWRFPIADFGAPASTERFAVILDRAADRLRRGDALLVHCAAGIGRTGTFAAGVLLRFGLGRRAASDRVRAAGSHAEHPLQSEALDRLAGRSEP